MIHNRQVEQASFLLSPIPRDNAEPKGSHPSHSGFDFNWSADRDGAPKLLYLAIRQGNTTISPVRQPVDWPEKTKPVFDAVNHDRAPRGSSPAFGKFHIMGVRVGYMQDEMICAFGIPPVDGVQALRRFPVSLKLLGANRLPSQRHRVGLYSIIISKKCKSPGAFLNKNPVGNGVRGQRLILEVVGKDGNRAVTEYCQDNEYQ